MVTRIVSHNDLDVYRRAFALAAQVYEFSKRFPKEETYSLTDQIRRSSRSVCSNLAEAWRKRIYEAAFVAKINDSEGEAAETQVWLEFAVSCDYLGAEVGIGLRREYHGIIATLVSMRNDSQAWVLPSGQRSHPS
jgi:four helix bundle protein